MPFGMNEGYTMGFTVDLGILNFTQTYGADTLNWSTVRQSIIDGRKRTAGVENKRTVAFDAGISGLLGLTYNVDLSIPNRWYLVSNGGDGGATLDYLHFHGLQDLKPEKTFDLTTTIFEITCLDIHFSCYKVIDEYVVKFKDYSMNDRLLTATGSKGSRVLWDFYVTNFTSDENTWKKAELSNNEYRMIMFDDFIEYLDHLRFTIYKAFTRTAIGAAVKTYTNHFLSHITFLKQTVNQDALGGAALTTAQLYFIAYATIAGGGELDTRSDISLFGEFETAWDILSTATDGYACKGVVRYALSELTTDRHVVTWHKLYTPISALITIGLDDVVKDSCEMTVGKNVPSLIVGNVRVPDGDVNQYKKKYTGLSSEHNDEFTVIWHTNITAAGCKTIENSDGHHSTYRQDDYLDNSRKLFYFDTDKWIKAHDYNSVDLGSYDGVETNVILAEDGTSWSDLGFPPGRATYDGKTYEYNNIDNTKLEQWLNEWRYRKIGIPRQVAKAKGSALCRNEVAYIKFINPFKHKDKALDVVFTLDEIGEIVNFPLDTINDSLNPPYSNKGQVVRVKTDWIKMTTEVTLWMRGF